MNKQSEDWVEHNEKRPYLLSILGVSIIGAAVALFATNQTLQIQDNALAVSDVCQLNAWINCTVAHASSYAVIAGIPVAWLGFLFYLWLSTTIAWTNVSQYKSETVAVTAFVVSLGVLVFTLYNATIMIFKLRVLCIVCVMMYAVNIGIMLLFKRFLGLSLKNIPLFIKNVLQSVLKTTVNTRTSINPITYCFSLLLVLVIGGGSMNYFINNYRYHEKINVEEEIAKHFLQPMRNIMLDSSAPAWGNPRSTVIIIEFSDFQCPFCKIASFSLRRLLSEFRKNVQIRFVNFPLDKKINPYISLDSHEKAALAAKAAVCAQNNVDFWEYHDDIFRRQDEIDRELLITLATERGWDPESFEACMDSEETLQKVRNQIENGYRAQVEGTPTIFINARPIKYWYHTSILRGIIQQELRTSKIHQSILKNR